MKSFSDVEGDLKLNLKTNRTQNVGIYLEYVCIPLGINKIKYYFEVKLEAPPKALISYQMHGLEVAFTAEDPNNQNLNDVTYFWDFGDGVKQSTKAKSVIHKFTNPGLYPVKLIAIDKDGITDEDAIELDLRELNFTAFLQVKVNGTYLFVDTVGGIQPEFGTFLRDVKVSPTTFSLTELYRDLNLREGDKVVLQAVGLHIPGPGWGNVANGLIAVFLDQNNNFLKPGDDGDFNSIQTPPTYPVGFPTDIPQDFYISTSQPTSVQIPLGAQKIAFSPNDNFFADNTDPDNDYGVNIKITVIKNTDLPLN